MAQRSSTRIAERMFEKKADKAAERERIVTMCRNTTLTSAAKVQ